MLFRSSADGQLLGEVKIGHDADPKVNKVTVPLSNVPSEAFNMVMKITKSNLKESQMVAITSMKLIAK